MFFWIPVETIVKEHQQEYYQAIGESDKNGNSTKFVTFMLECILKSLEELKSDQESNQETGLRNDERVLSAIEKDGRVTITQLQQLTSLSESGVKKILRKLKQEERIRRVGATKNGRWEIED